MPDSSGKIRGITVPSVPWHEDHWPTSQMAREIPIRRAQNKATQALIEARHILQGETPTQIKHDEALRDADQMLWDKQTDEGPSALEKLRDK